MAAGAKVAIRLCCARLLRDACAQRHNAWSEGQGALLADEAPSWNRPLSVPVVLRNHPLK